MESGTLGENLQRHMPRGHLLMLVLIVLLTPCVFLTERAALVDSSYMTVTLAAPLWAFSHSYGSDYGGPFDRTTLSLMDLGQLRALVVLAISLYLFVMIRRFAINHERRDFGVGVGITSLALIAYSGSLWVTVCFTFFHGGVALPLVPILGSIIVYHGFKHQE